MAERIVSPGVFTREKDLSFLPQAIEAIGAAIIGPTVQGPAFVPTTISNYEEFVRAFGLSFESGSGTSKLEYKYLTNYAAQQYLKYGETLTVIRVLNDGYEDAYSYVVSSGSYKAAITAGTGSFTSSIFTPETDASFKLTLLSPGDIQNSGNTVAANNGLGNPILESSNNILQSGSRNNLRWEVRDVRPSRGTFDLYIRRGDDRHNRRVIVEQYNDVSLDPQDSNFISRVIGDQVMTMRYDSDGVPFLQLSGSYPNRSRYVRVEVLKNTLNYLNSNGTIRENAYSASLPLATSGAFAGGSDGYVHHPRAMYEEIYQYNSQGFNLSGNSAASGSTAYRDAIDILSNQDEYDINMLLLPGMIDNLNGHSDIYTYALNMVENRGDIFLVIDPTTFGSTIGQAIIAAEGRDSSYAAMYYPWVQVPDPDIQRNVWIPPSTVIGGVVSFNDYVREPWYAPAGLNRGGIELALQAERKLTHADRNALYVVNVNPIATFPRDGVVVWGQKTLQKKRSALDRVNVRRLLIAAKKFIASSSRYLVFEQNTEQTRDAFKRIANPYFRSIQERQGLYDFRVIMDERNNTPDVIDRNELRGEIYLKPTRTAEFIIIDFYVLPTGATFPGDARENAEQ